MIEGCLRATTLRATKSRKSRASMAGQKRRFAFGFFRGGGAGGGGWGARSMPGPATPRGKRSKGQGQAPLLHRNYPKPMLLDSRDNLTGMPALHGIRLDNCESSFDSHQEARFLLGVAF